MRPKNRGLAAVFILVILLAPAGYYLLHAGSEKQAAPIDGTALWTDPDGNTHVPGDDGDTVYDGKVVGVAPPHLLGGQFNALSVDSWGPVVLLQPRQALFALPDDRGYQVQNTSYLPLAQGQTFYLLVAPTATELHLEFYGHDSFDFDLEVSEGPDPLVSGKKVYDLMEAVTDDASGPPYENGFNERWVSQGSPGLERGASYFASLFESYGLEAEVQRYTNPDTGALIINVVALKWGEDRSTFIGVGGHMDIAAPAAPLPQPLPGYGTVQGAYDDTSGTVHTLVLARALADLDTRNSYFFGLWSAEEEGIWGSGEFVDSFQDNYPGASIKAYLNLDMVGINWPGVDPATGEYFPLYGNVGGQYAGGQTEPVPGFEALINWSAYSFMGYPNTSAFQFGHSNMGRSDHRSFQNIGVPSAFYIGAYDEGYDAYHRLEDTLSNMKQQMGGQEDLEAGFQVTVWLSLVNLLLLDGEDPS